MHGGILAELVGYPGACTPIMMPIGRVQKRLRPKVSNQAIELILHSLWDKTNSNYESAWKSWEENCQSKDILVPFWQIFLRF